MRTPTSNTLPSYHLSVRHVYRANKSDTLYSISAPLALIKSQPKTREVTSSDDRRWMMILEYLPFSVLFLIGAAISASRSKNVHDFWHGASKHRLLGDKNSDQCKMNVVPYYSGSVLMNFTLSK